MENIEIVEKKEQSLEKQKSKKICCCRQSTTQGSIKKTSCVGNRHCSNVHGYG
jgi:hypothetical protein